MLQQIKNKLYKYYLGILYSIAFFPSIISMGMLILALLLLSIEDNELTKFLIENAPSLVINNADTARAILATLIGGILSLTVFSFSMVMVLLNQASSNFSPRLLPGLISDKKNQVVLGIYLGTIIYNIIVLISILPSGDEYTINGFSVLIGIVLGIISLGMFVFFIHSISSDIQIDNILNKIFNQAKDRLEDLIELDRKEGSSFENSSDWNVIKAKKATYFDGVNLDGLKDFASKNDTNIHVLAYKGKYLLPNMPILKFNTNLDQKNICELEDLLIYSNNHNVYENYVLGIKQIAEVGVKAMSPGINDPGTAVMTIDYITELLALRMQLNEHEIYQDQEKKYKIELTTINFETLIYQILAAYRQYCKHDIILMEKIILMIQYLQAQDSVNDSYLDVLKTQIKIIKEDIKNNITNEYDLKVLQQLL